MQERERGRILMLLYDVIELFLSSVFFYFNPQKLEYHLQSRETGDEEYVDR